MCHTVKIFERIIDGRLGQEVTTGRQQFGFRKDLGTTDYFLPPSGNGKTQNQKDLNKDFIDLEKTNDRIPREELWRSQQERAVPEKYVRMIKGKYRRIKTKVRSARGTASSFEVSVWLHQGLVRSPFLFSIIMDVITQDVRENPPWWCSMLMIFCCVRKPGRSWKGSWRTGEKYSREEERK